MRDRAPRSVSAMLFVITLAVIFGSACVSWGKTSAKPPAASKKARHPCEALIKGVCKTIDETDRDGQRTDAHVAAMKARTAVPERYQEITVTDILKLPSCPTTCPPEKQPICGTVCRRDILRFAKNEQRAVQATGELCYINPEGDGDLHMELADPGTDCPMAINPFRQLIVEATPHFLTSHPAWNELLNREQSKFIGGDHHPEAVIPTSPPLRQSRQKGLLIRVSGLLLRDTHSEGARSGWEIHPITRIECQNVTGEWIEFSRPNDCAAWQK